MMAVGLKRIVLATILIHLVSGIYIWEEPTEAPRAIGEEYVSFKEVLVKPLRRSLNFLGFGDLLPVKVPPPGPGGEPERAAIRARLHRLRRYVCHISTYGQYSLTCNAVRFAGMLLKTFLDISAKASFDDKVILNDPDVQYFIRIVNLMN